jgi:hypothetical protein
MTVLSRSLTSHSVSDPHQSVTDDEPVDTLVDLFRLMGYDERGHHVVA